MAPHDALARIAGVTLSELTEHHDQRGSLTELFHGEWPGVPPAVQWNLLRSHANVLRGVHVHRRHWDYVVVVSGKTTIGLCDLRDEAGAGSAALIELAASALQALVIPPGVAHGFHFTEPAMMMLGVSHSWNTADELGCRWDDAGLGIPWPAITPALSERDRALGSLAELRAELRRHRP